MNQPSQEYLNSIPEGTKVWIEWTGGNTGVFRIKKVNERSYAYLEAYDRFQPEEYREEIILHSLHDLADCYVWKITILK